MCYLSDSLHVFKIVKYHNILKKEVLSRFSSVLHGPFTLKVTF